MQNESSATSMRDSLGRRNNRKLPNKTCDACGKEYRPSAATSRFCSRPCQWSQNGGYNVKDGPIWWVDQKGYIVGRIWQDGKRVFVRQHRYVMEEHIGRKLEKSEDVHHVDGNKQNNEIENLQILCHRKHSTVTNSGRTYTRGYKLELTDEERQKRSERMKAIRRVQVKGGNQ